LLPVIVGSRLGRRITISAALFLLMTMIHRHFGFADSEPAVQRETTWQKRKRDLALMLAQGTVLGIAIAILWLLLG